MKRVYLTLTMALIVTMSLWAKEFTLNGNWQFKETSQKDWNTATVPGNVHTDLMQNNMFKDPFIGTNEKELQWIGEKDWEYRRSFSVTADMLQYENLELVLNGIDTYADVYINDFQVQKCDNMFRTWTINAKPYLQEGENHIRFYFHSIFKVDMSKYLNAPFRLQAWPNNDQNEHIWLSLYARKAGYHYGWDWGPRLITCGIWRDIYFNGWNKMQFDGVQIATESISKKSAQMAITTTINATEATSGTLAVKSEGKTLLTKTITLNTGTNNLKYNFNVKNPRLWWSAGLGEQNQYDFDVVVKANDMQIAQSITTGIRTIEVVREKDEWGKSLYIKLNGQPVYMKGANYIPLDNFVNRVSKSDYEYVIKSAVDANMNMLRVWGGGIYEADVFYELCDKYGILVWQDIMFACGMFPADEHYLQSVTHEVKDNVKRLRNHPSIAMWCGNNENEISYFEWGWQKKYSKEDDAVYQNNLQTLFYNTIPNAIESADATRYYHPTSPNTGYHNIPYNMGDAHFWSVWKGGWIEEYMQPKNIARFMSEYGFQSYPEMSTIDKFVYSNWDKKMDTEVMLSHQRAKNDATRDPHYGNKMMTMYMEKYFVVPTDFQEFLYVSQLLQAEAVKVAIEAHRRAKPYCMGTLYWQINDCWPAASWSSIDYYGRWKALHYFAKQAYNDVLVSPYMNGDKISIKVISDRTAALKAQVQLTAMTIQGDIIAQFTQPCTVKANESTDVYHLALSAIDQYQADNFVLYAEVIEKGAVISSNHFYPTYANTHTYANVAPDMDIVKTDSGLRLTFTTDKLVRGLYMWVADYDTKFSDNYITINPTKAVEVEVTTELSIKEFKKQLKTLSVKDIIK